MLMTKCIVKYVRSSSLTSTLMLTTFQAASTKRWKR